MQHPPERFTPRWVSAHTHALPAFECAFDLRTTLDDESNAISRFVRSSSLIAHFTRLRTMFVGTTVTEYAPVPSIEQFGQFFNSMAVLKGSAQLIIIKDIPEDSPLLPEHANEHARALIQQARESKFLVLFGQALAYVPIDFASIEEYLSRLSHSRRKEFRRKLKSRAKMTVEQVETGSVEFTNAQLVDQLYELYLNVYEQSKYHFDKLSKEFFKAILTRRDCGGIVFLYREGSQLIGFNICFLHNGMLVDKYVGFQYPQARDMNLYFVSWFTNLEFSLRHRLTHYVAGWTDPEVKKSLGAKFTFTRHAVYIVNPVLRAVLSRFQQFFEPDANWARRDVEAP